MNVQFRIENSIFVKLQILGPNTYSCIRSIKYLKTNYQPLGSRHGESPKELEFNLTCDRAMIGSYVPTKSLRQKLHLTTFESMTYDIYVVSWTTDCEFYCAMVTSFRFNSSTSEVFESLNSVQLYVYVIGIFLYAHCKIFSNNS